MHKEALLTDIQPNIPHFSTTSSYHSLKNLTYQQKPSTQNNYKPNTTQTYPKQQLVANLNPKPRSRTFSNDDYEEKRRKNLCFWCDEKYSPTHKCEKKKLYNLQVITAKEESEFFHEAGEFSEEEEESDQKFTLCAVNGGPLYSTLKLAGQIKDKSVVFLIDSGSTHNIVSSVLVEKLQLETKPVPPYKVCLANGKEVKGNAQCSQLKWNTGEERFEMDALILIGIINKILYFILDIEVCL